MYSRLSNCMGFVEGVLVVGLAFATACTPGPQARPGPAGVRPLARPPVPGAPAGVTAFLDVAVVPMDTERVLLGQTVLVQHGWITALGPTSQVRVPASAVRIEGRNKFLMPGLADCHFHAGAFGPENAIPSSDSVAAWRLFRWLADGVTTVRNLDYWNSKGSTLPEIPGLDYGPDLLRLRARAAAGEIWSPRIYTSGPWGPVEYLNKRDNALVVARLGPPARPAAVLRLDSVAAYVAAYQAAGYDFIKVHDETAEVFDSVLAAARRVGIPVVGHVSDSTLALTAKRLQLALAGGMRSIEHLTGYDFEADTSLANTRALAAATKRAGVWNCPTLRWKASPPRARLITALQEAGAGLLLGTDFPVGPSVHGELKKLVEAGLTPYQALATGTTNVAEYFGTRDSTGTVAVGKRADLVLVNGNPLQDIGNAAGPAGVMIGGRWLAREALDRRLAAIDTVMRVAERGGRP